MDKNYDYRLPRLFIETDLAENSTIPLDDDSAHYLKNVLRRPDGSQLRVFNGRHGEFLAFFTAVDRKKYNLTVESQIRPQPNPTKEIHLVFAPIKKDRQDFMIEKSVELGATHFHPVLTQQTVIRDLNEKRVAKQIQEASEQSERLALPELNPLQKLAEFIRDWPEEISLLAAIERQDTVFLGEITIPNKCAFLIGPEGGFSESEREMLLSNKKITPVGLGDQILRAETAALFGLSLIVAHQRPN